jgi:hypothetical protein
MAKQEKPGALERDFGYLFPFFEKIAAAALAMPAGPERARVEQLVGEERGRWEEIRALVGGKKTPAVRAESVRVTPEPRSAAGPVTAANVDGGGRRPARGLTVGSLRTKG